MSAKPGTLPRWANAGGAIVVPPSGTLDVGHTAGSQPLHSYENWYKNLVYQWVVWLNDGDLTINTLIANTSVTTTALTTTGAITAAGVINANGGIVIPTGKALDLQGTTTLTSGATAATNQHFKTQGTGEYKYTGERITPISAGEAESPSNVGTPLQFSVIGRSWSFGTSVEFLFYPVKVIVGDVITSWRVYFNKASATGTITGQLQKVDPTTAVVTNIGSAANNNSNNPGFIQLNITGLTETVLDDSYYFIRVQGGSVTGDQSYGARFTNTHP